MPGRVTTLCWHVSSSLSCMCLVASTSCEVSELESDGIFVHAYKICQASWHCDQSTKYLVCVSYPYFLCVLEYFCSRVQTLLFLLMEVNMHRVRSPPWHTRGTIHNTPGRIKNKKDNTSAHRFFTHPCSPQHLDLLPTPVPHNSHLLSSCLVPNTTSPLSHTLQPLLMKPCHLHAGPYTTSKHCC